MRRGPVGAAELSRGQRRYLYVTAALTGGAIMIVEILGAKMLAPYFGTSHFVWTAQIAVTLVALAVGYYAGGRLVDRAPHPGGVYAGMIMAAVYLCLTVLAAGPVANWSLQFNLAAGSLVTSALLFLPPLALLAMVGPVFVRVLTDSVGVVGRNVGRLTAISTAGSFAGTILIGYVLIPFLPNSVSMYLTGALLLGIGAGYFIVCRRRVSSALVAVVLAGLVLGYAGVHRRDRYARSVELERRNSNFGMLQVLDDAAGHCRYLLNDYLMQNSYDPVTRQSLSPFTEILYALARGYTPRIDDVLCIGLGVGIVPMQFVRDGARVDAVEINPAVLPLATRYFDLDPRQMNIVIGDGRYFVNRCTNRYDVVILDAFLGDAVPSHLMTREAFAGMRRLLRPGGTLVINSAGNLDTGKTFCTASLEKTLRAVFTSVRVHANPQEVGVLNVSFVASDRTDLVLDRERSRTDPHPRVRQQVSATLLGSLQTSPDQGKVLTDQYNPVEYYDAAAREEVRRQIALLVPEL